MCTVIVLRRPGHPWPLVLAANRDEMADRPWRPPGRHWPDRPHVVAGLDEKAGGSWLGLNDHGVVAGVLNRVDSLGSAKNKKSRGELVLEALDHSDATAAATQVSHLNAGDYRSFNMVVADNQNAFWLRNLDEERGAEGGPATIEVFELPPGLSMITARDRNDPTSPRIHEHLPRLEKAEPPDPRSGNWRDWLEILKSRKTGEDHDPEGAMTIVTDSGFGTVSSSLIGLPGIPQSLRETPIKPVWRFAPGRPDKTPYEPVEL
ncbi:MAG: NRDE family protein [Kiloniellales bacterium]